MAPKYFGRAGFELLSTNPEYVQGQGWILNESYRGTPQGIEGLTNQLISKGYEFRITNDGPYLRLDARKLAEKANDNSFQDTYTIRKEAISRDIWSLNSVDKEMLEFAGIDPGGEPPTSIYRYRKLIEDAINSDDVNAVDELTLGGELDVGLYPTATNLLIEILRGVSYYEDEYTTLARSRTVGNAYTTAVPLELKSKSIIYPIAGPGNFFDAFGIPTIFAASFPPLPSADDTPSQTVWGWRPRRQEVDFGEGQEIHIVEDWVLAFWSKNLYDASLFGKPYPPLPVP